MHADMRCKNYLGFSREVRPLVWLVLGDRAARVSRFTRDSSGFETELLWPVVQSWISAKPRLKFNLLLQFMYFCMSVYFKTSEKTTPTDTDKISEDIFPNL